jgi:endo-1,4-beta-xylanase
MSASTSPPSSPSLREHFAGSFELGTCVGGTLPASLRADELELLERHFAVLTPENCMKPGPTHPERGRFDFTAPDALVRFAEARGMSVVGHCLCWHQQSPPWLFASGLGREAALDQLREHIHGVAGRYRGRLQGWDVVNEAIAEEGEYLRDTPALRAIGPDFVRQAFELARAADPGARLYYNDYDIERPAKRQRTLRLLRELLASGARVDGVGIQGHWILDRVPFDDIRAAIRDYAALGLTVMITELDIDVVPRAGGADVAARPEGPTPDPYPEGCPEDVLARQAQQYARLFEIFRDASSRVSRVSFWGLHDGASWLNYWPSPRTNHPLLFDRRCRPKPAFRALVANAPGGEQ